MTTSKLLAQVKDAEQDFEWYPTTKEIISIIKNDIGDETHQSMLDCGAGDGRVLEQLTNGDKYAIEKSMPLLNALSADVFVVGTEFNEQTLIDKKVDLVFSNPPYSEFVQWSTKIIREANSDYVYLVIPQRWKDSDEINDAIAAREAEVKVLGSFDFLDADRAARAKVNVLRIRLRDNSQWRGQGCKVDPFTLWFEENFKIEIGKTESSKHGLKQSKKKQIDDGLQYGLVKGGDVVSTLEQLYTRDLEKLLTTYQSLSDVDPVILQELDVNLDGVRSALSMKVEGLKDIYWSELFNNLTKVTERLTSKSRKTLLDTLTAHTHVDFTITNAHAVLCWVVKNANQYFDSQLITTVERLVEKANVSLYKSNEKTFGEQEWRYTRQPDDLDNYSLDYRIVLARVGGLELDSWNNNEVKGLSDRATNLINDLCTVASNIGFDTTGLARASDFSWSSGKSNSFTYKDITSGDLKPLFDVKAFKNGNLHIKFNQSFMAKLNIEFGRLKGWLKTAKQASQEMDVSIEIASESFGSNLMITSESTLLMLGDKAA